jgi:hypothetical protein
MRFIRARLPNLGPKEADEALHRVSVEGEIFEGIRPDDLLRIPHIDFFRRRGVPAFGWIGVDGEKFEELDSYVAHLMRALPDAYRAGRDFKFYLEAARGVEAGEMTSDEAARKVPGLRRVGGVCPCSNAVRWVADVETNGAPSV